MSHAISRTSKRDTGDADAAKRAKAQTLMSRLTATAMAMSAKRCASFCRKPLIQRAAVAVLLINLGILAVMYRSDVRLARISWKAN